MFLNWLSWAPCSAMKATFEDECLYHYREKHWSRHESKKWPAQGGAMVPKDDGGSVPEAGHPQRRQGRQPKDLSDVSESRREFAEVMRGEFFDRLAALGVTTAQISAGMGKGFSGAQLSRFRSGEQLPGDRDQVLRLLAYAEEVVGQPLPDGVREYVLEKYYKVLEHSNGKLHDLYRLMDMRDRVVGERDEALEKHRLDQIELVKCQESLREARAVVARLEFEAGKAEREEAQRQQREEASENEVRRLQDQQDQLTRAARGARSEQQAAHKEIRRLQDLLVQQRAESARSEKLLKGENTALAEQMSQFRDRVADLERAEQSLRTELDQVAAALAQAEARSSELGSRHEVVLHSRAVIGERLSAARRHRRDLADKLTACRERETAAMRKLTDAQKHIADLESRLVAAFRSRDALLEHPSAPGEAVAEAEETVDAAWRSVEKTVLLIEAQAVVVPDRGTTPAGAAPAEEPAGDDSDGPDGGEGTPVPVPEPVSPAASRPPEKPPARAAGGLRGRLRWPWDDPGLDKDPRILIRLYAVIALLMLATAIAGLLWGQRGDGGDKNSPDDSVTDEPAAQGPTPQWALALPQPLDGRPVLDGAVVVAAAWSGEVYGVNAQTGKQLWTVPTKGRNGRPVTSGGLTHIYSDGELKTIDTRTGEVKWTKSDFLDSIAAAEGSLVEVHRSKVVSVSPGDGNDRWSVPVDEPIVGRPALTKDKVYLSNEKGEVSALDLKTGTVRWSKALESIDKDQDPIMAGTALIVATSKQIVALDSSNGNELWHRDYTVYSRDMLAASGLLIFTAPLNDGVALIALDQTSGAMKWSFAKTAEEAQVYGYLSASTDRVYAAYDNEQLCAYQITDGTRTDCFANVNSIPGTAATSDGVYANSHNQRLYFFRKDALG
ncbi:MULTISPECIES: outer membrane protein assembly factor BamB family protein [unclassified Streptomyces]|uniref:outer membrane protein assembly factor BamB family protein n=1 Tax=unclassified Streptomyces TaxID=2593676 RepID=UPI002E357594|nr:MULTISPECIES: PQQ-binding-like beta-propeller repeat protein [unclassified Streptomyces]